MLPRRLTIFFFFLQSIFFIWLRWLLPAVATPIAPALETAGTDHGRRRPFSCLPGTSTSHRSLSHTITNLESPPTPPKCAYRGRARRVSFADSPHSEIGKATDEDVTRADITVLIASLPDSDLHSCTSASVPSTPNTSQSPSPTLALTPTLSLEDSTDHELVPTPAPRRSNSTSHLMPKIKSPFHSRHKRSSLPSSLLEGSSGSWFC